MTAVTYEREAMRPLDVDGTIYAIYDRKGDVIGTGTREVCETLLYIIGRASGNRSSVKLPFSTERRSNVRSAIAI